MKRLLCRALALMLCCMLPMTSLAEAVVLPGQVTAIEAEAFFGDESMTSAIVPEGAVSIGERAFAYSGLTSIVLPASLEEIADNAFEGCDGLVATVSDGSYALSYCQENGIDYRLAEEDIAARYSISGLELSGSEIIAAVSTYDACEILIQVLSEEDESTLYAFAGYAGADLYSENVSVTVPASVTLPDYFILRAVLRDAAGNELCSPFTTLHYTSAFAEFESKTAEDYGSGEVLDYGEHGFAIAVADAIRISSIAATSDENAYTFAASEAPSVGDVLLLTTDGSYYEPIKVLSVTDSGDGMFTIVRDASATLSDLYDAVKINATMAAGAVQTYASSDDGALEGSTGLSSRLEAGQLTVDVTGTATVGIQTLYDKTLFGEKYSESEVFVELNLTATGTIDLLDEGMLKPEMGYEKPELVLYDGPLSIYGSASPLAAELSVTIPFDYEFRAGGTFVLEIYHRSGFKFTPDNGAQPFKVTESDCRMELGGGFMVQAGPKVELSAVLLRGVITAAISGQIGLRADGEAVYIVEDMNLGEKTHACDLCCNGEASVFADVKADLTAGIDDDYRVTLLGFNILSLKISLGELYVSIINDEDSPFGGKIEFDWGECPNYKYRTMVYTQDVSGTEITGLPVSVKSGSTEKGSGESPYRIYLYNGQYTAEAEYESGISEKDFTVYRRAQEVIIGEQKIEVSGTVMDAAAMEPVSGAHVTATLSEDHAVSTVTNDEGFYLMTFEPADSFGLLITADGYKDWTTAITPDSESAITVDAQLIPDTYTVTFSPGMGSGTMEPLTVNGGEAFTLPSCGFTPPQNMRFSAWSIDGETYAAGSTYTSPAGDVAVYAVWEKSLIPDNAVIYNGHAYMMYPVNATWSDAQTLCAAAGGHLVTINSAGEQEFVAAYASTYDFQAYMWIGCANPWSEWVTGEAMSYTNWGAGEPDGWSGQYYGCMLINDEYKGGSYHIMPGQWDDWQGPTAYYMCEWDSIPLTYELSFNLNGSSGTVGSMTLFSGNSIELPTPDRYGYTFDGWNTAEDGSGETITSSASITSDMTLYAQWTKIEADIPEGAVTYNGHSYMLFDEYYAWSDASALCESLGGHLVTITDAEEQAFMESYVTQTGARNAYWMGLSCESDQVWKWVNGETFDYSNPDKWSVDYWGSAPYAMIFQNYNTIGAWADLQYIGYISSDTSYMIRYPEQFGYICEWDLESAAQ